MIWLPAILFFAILAGNLIIDKGKNHNDVNHKKEAVIKVLALMPSIFLFVWYHPLGHSWWALLIVPNVLFMEFFVYWTLFDGLENIINLHKGWTYLGDGDGINDSWLDAQQRKYGKTLSLIFKMMGCFIFTLLYTLTVIY